jgi:hypothetical protein
MNLERHTPTPWTFHGGPIVDSVDCNDGSMVASLGRARPRDAEGGSWLSQEHAAEVGRLLAAAPELLAACKAALPYYEACDDEDAVEVAATIRAAIAKAEGGAR